MVIFAAMLVAVLDQLVFVTDIITVEMGQMKLTAVSNCVYISPKFVVYLLCIYAHGIN